MFCVDPVFPAPLRQIGSTSVENITEYTQNLKIDLPYGQEILVKSLKKKKKRRTGFQGNIGTPRLITALLVMSFPTTLLIYIPHLTLCKYKV